MYLLIFTLGAALASFFHLVVERRERGESWISGSSHCNHCMKAIPPYGLIPIGGYFLVRGRCVHCGGKVSPLHPLVELMGGATALILYMEKAGPLLMILVLWGFYLTIEDLLFREVGALSLELWLLATFLYAIKMSQPLIPGGLIFAVYTGFSKFTGAIGDGDGRYAAAVSFLLADPWNIVYYILHAHILAGAVALISLLTVRGREDREMAMFPFFFISGILHLLFF
ncbi:MAG: prepilin peptidase [Tissierellia bacterium]|nr:prepilin peptidase [Tissierellia bacterium]